MKNTTSNNTSNTHSIDCICDDCEKIIMNHYRTTAQQYLNSDCECEPWNGEYCGQCNPKKMALLHGKGN